MRDHGCMVQGCRTTLRVINPWSRVSASLIVAKGRGNKRVMSIGAGNRRSATPRIVPASQLAHSRSGDMREAGAERWPTFCGLRRFAADFKSDYRQLNANDAKPHKPQNRRKAKGWGSHSHQRCRTASSGKKSGREGAVKARSKSPSTLPAPPKASVFEIRP